MDAYFKLGIAALLPVIAAAGFVLLERKTVFGRWSERGRQALYGIVFGLLAILGTEWGIGLSGAQMNCRDAAVLVAGLFFGSPAGLIAGVIGGVERWFSVYWGVGAFTRTACTLSTLIAGVYSALLRKFMFEDKKPGWLLAGAIGVVMEVFHLTMVFITNMDEPTRAMAAVRACTAPMVLANGLSVMLAGIVLTLLARETRKKQSHVRISQTVQRWLLVTVLLAFAATSYFVFSLQDRIAQAETDSFLTLALDEAEANIGDAIKAGGPDEEDFMLIAKNRHIREGGYLLILDGENRIRSAPSFVTEEVLRAEWEKIGENAPPKDVTFLSGSEGTRAFCRYRAAHGYTLIAVLPEEEAHQMRNIALYVNTFMEILVFAVLFGLIYLLIKRVVVNQIQSINGSLSKIAGGDLDEVVNVRTNEEFSYLSDDINSTVATLKRYIAEASARIDRELQFAKDIQTSALPGTFPAFPKRRDFDIYAAMDPAREVGGDFYDFYLNEERLQFLIADVSGKGIPAAMFMMRAKTELKSLTETGITLSEVFARGNRALCEGNDAGMFVTAWQGDLDPATGKVRFVNAGHNAPLLRHGDGDFEFLRAKSGFVLAGMDGMTYREQEITLSPGDTLYLYTDGVTEATDVNNTLYGEERLLQTLNAAKDAGVRELCDAVRADLERFVGDAPQFDDITMLSLRYLGNGDPSLRIERVKAEDISALTAFAEEKLEEAGCPAPVVMKIDTAIDEIVSNVVRYAYPAGEGPITLGLHFLKVPQAVEMTFTDEGIPYDPLAKEDPDVTLSAEERQIGGLGIYMVKKIMDGMTYRYEHGKNILTVTKRF